MRLFRGRHDVRGPEYTAPRNDTEAAVVEIFQELFGLRTIGIYHNFFHLGGDSLLAVQLARRIHARFGVQVPLRTLWDIRTAAEVALLVTRLEADEGFAPSESAESTESTEKAFAEPQPA